MQRTKRWLAIFLIGMLAIPQVGAYAEELTDGTAAFEEIMSETEELPVIGASGITDYDLSVTVGGTQSITLTSSSALNNPSCISADDQVNRVIVCASAVDYPPGHLSASAAIQFVNITNAASGDRGETKTALSDDIVEDVFHGVAVTSLCNRRNIFFV